MTSQLERVALADTLWEEMIREEAQAIADRENACAGCCGPRGTDTWLDHEQSVRQRFEEIGKAFSARAAIAAMQGELIEVPEDLAGLLRSLSRAEWGQTEAHDAEGHGNHITASVRLTAEHFGQQGPQHMHGLYLEGTGTVICHTGTSPNSPQIARALTGAWNFLLDNLPPAPTGEEG